MRFVKTRNGSGPTRFLHVFGAGSSLGSSADSIGDVFREFGPVEVVLIESKRFCFVVYEGVTLSAMLSGHLVISLPLGQCNNLCFNPLGYRVTSSIISRLYHFVDQVDNSEALSPCRP